VKCIKCNSDMVNGTVQNAAENSFFGFFSTDNEKTPGRLIRRGKEFVILSGEEVQAYYCPNCRMFIMTIEE